MKVIRKRLGKTTVEPNVKGKIEAGNKDYQDIFEATWFNDKPVIYCSDVRALILRLKTARMDNPDYYKLGSDYGQGNLKLVLSAIDSSNVKSRKCELKTTGVKQAIIIALALETSESHEALTFLFAKTNVEEALAQENWFFSSDLKVGFGLIFSQKHWLATQN